MCINWCRSSTKKKLLSMKVFQNVKIKKKLLHKLLQLLFCSYCSDVSVVKETALRAGSFLKCDESRNAVIITELHQLSIKIRASVPRHDQPAHHDASKIKQEKDFPVG
ncbi:hypothetical protein XENORESO_006461 [Xenotaenia resolanae]|uniref:Uncharacterized protein n=1 Tax=Xenotaenia resolanae TaxID=208358 RepID=A0ABV0WVR3_9TELE